MDKCFILACLILGGLVCSCSTEVLNNADFDDVPANVENSGIEKKDASSYISWIDVDRQGLKQDHYETEISYPVGVDSVINPIYATSIRYQSYRLRSEVPIRERSKGNIIIRSYKCEYLVCYDGFEIPVSFNCEKAYIKNSDGEIFMPSFSTKYSLKVPELTELADEKIGEKEYCCYKLECGATAQTDEISATAKSTAKIMIEKEPIVFADPVIEPWHDGGNVDAEI